MDVSKGSIINISMKPFRTFILESLTASQLADWQAESDE